MIFITDELGKFEKNIIELAENVGFKECKTIEAIDLFCGISERNDVLKEKDRYYAFIDIPQYWSVRADGLNGAIYDNKTKKAKEAVFMRNLSKETVWDMQSIRWMKLIKWFRVLRMQSI